MNLHLCGGLVIAVIGVTIAEAQTSGTPEETRNDWLCPSTIAEAQTSGTSEDVTTLDFWEHDTNGLSRGLHNIAAGNTNSRSWQYKASWLSIFVPHEPPKEKLAEFQREALTGRKAGSNVAGMPNTVDSGKHRATSLRTQSTPASNLWNSAHWQSSSASDWARLNAHPTPQVRPLNLNALKPVGLKGSTSQRLLIGNEILPHETAWPANANNLKSPGTTRLSETPWWAASPFAAASGNTSARINSGPVLGVLASAQPVTPTICSEWILLPNGMMIHDPTFVPLSSGTFSWNDAANWTPSGVPTTNSITVLGTLGNGNGHTRYVDYNELVRSTNSIYSLTITETDGNKSSTLNILLVDSNLTVATTLAITNSASSTTTAGLVLRQGNTTNATLWVQGTLSLTNDSSDFAFITVSNSTTLIANALQLEGSTVFTNFGSVSLTNAWIQPNATYDQDAGSITVLNVVTNQGSFLLDAGSASIANFTNATGGFLFVSNSVLNISGTLFDQGIVTVAGNATGLWNNFILAANGVLSNAGSVSSTNAWIQSGATFTQSAGSITVNSVTTNQGSFLLADGLGGFFNFTNAAGGNLLVTNSVMNVSGTMYNQGVITIAGGATSYWNNVTLGTGGVLTNAPGGSIYIAGNLDNRATNNAANSFNGGFIFNGSPAGGVATQQVEVASLYLATNATAIATTNFFFKSFQVGDPVTGSNAYVQLVNNQTNRPGANSPEILAVSNLNVATSGSTLDFNNRTAVVFNLSNSGTMLWTNANNPAGTVIHLDVVNTFTNQGTMRIGNGTVLQLSNAFYNGTAGRLVLTNSGVLTNFSVGSTLTNLGTIFGDGLVTPTVSNGVGATVTANAATLRLGGGLASNLNYGTLGTTNGGTLAVNNATLTNASGATISMQSGTFTLTGGGSNVVNLGTIIGYGTNATVINNQAGGSIIATGGVLRLAGGFTNGAGAAVNAGLLAARGPGSELNVAMAFTNLGSVSLSGGTLTAPGVNNSGSVLGYGTFNAALNNSGGVTNNTSGQTLTFTQPVTNNAGGTMSALNSSRLAFNSALQNGGTITVQDQSTATFAGTVTNTGSITVQNQSLLTFNTDLTNNGTLAFGPVINPSTVVISGNLTLGSSGVISMNNLTNNTLVMQGNFVNGSTNNTSYDTSKGVTVFGAAGGLTTNTFEVAGKNLGTNVSGFNNNFAVGTLNVTNGIRFADYVNNGGGGNSNEVLYVDVLHLFSGATMKLSGLTIYVGLEFIYEDNSGTKTINSGIINQANAASMGLVNVSIDNGGQIVFVPEASTWALMGLGLVFIALGKYARRRRCI